MKNRLFNFPLGGGGLRGIETKLLIIGLLGLIFFSSCKKEIGNVIVEGRVINVGTQQPIEGVTVEIENEVSFTPSHLDSTFTNANGEFSIELPNEDDMMIIYPNPVKNELKLEVKGFESYPNLELQVYSNTGKLVHSGKINTNQHVVVNVTTFAQGIYYCKIMSNQTELYKTEFVKVK